MTGGGAERQMSYLVNHAVSSSYVCTLLTLSDTHGDRYEIDPRVVRIGLDVIAQSDGLWDSIVSNQRRVNLLRKAITDTGATAVVSFCDRMNIMTLAALRCSKLKDVRIAISERSDPRQQKLSWAWELLRRFYYRQCNICVAQTNAIAKYLQPIVGHDKPMFVIPTAIQKAESVQSLLPDAEQAYLNVVTNDDGRSRLKRLLYVGRLSQEKGIDRLLSAWSKIYNNHPQWRLLIAGEGSGKERWLRAVSADFQLADVESSIEWLGWISNVRSLMASCDAFVLPSRYEGFPNALVEAMDSSLPCVATDCSASIIEIIPDEQAGLRVTNDSEGLISGLSRLLTEDALRTQFREKAKLSVAKFSWSAVSRSWDDVLASLTVSHGRS
jgi:GalNAc-alpha-(1->4)-GalNAc-alpha-(1->3)-diNAcBac-PP-undecaprenol alpha-1,4-N-acetyl-D-galactosaminyltransferase